MDQQRNRETGRWSSSGEEFVCQECNFRSPNSNSAKSHRQRTEHIVSRVDSPDGANNESDTEATGSFHAESRQDGPGETRQDRPNLADAVGDREDNDDATYYGMGDNGDSDEEMPEGEDPTTEAEPSLSNDYSPFQSFSHFLLCLLMHGSHNHKISQSAVKVLILGLKHFTSDVPTLDDVVNFKCDYWEEKLLRQVTSVNGEDLSFISPSGQLALRLAHPLYSQFEKMPHWVDLENPERQEREGQSSGKKWWKSASCRSCFLNGRSLFEGDTFVFPEKVVRLSQFFRNQDSVYVEVHTYEEEVNMTGSETIVIVPHLVDNAQVAEHMKLEQLSMILSLRERNIDVELSRNKLVKNADDLLYQRQEISPEDVLLVPKVEQSMLDAGVTVISAVNIHLDDASMNPQSKVWKKATCVSEQLAGAPTGVGGFKHGDAGTMLLAVAPAKEISPIDLLQSMKPELDILQNGFKAYDYQSKQVVSVKAPIGVLEADLDAQRQLTPFKGASGFAYCSRDLISQDTAVEEEDQVIMRTRENLAQQMAEVEDAPTQAEKKALCIQYGLVPDRYPPVTDIFGDFDLFKDMACDTLHLLLLGIFKKFLISINAQLPNHQLQKAAAVVDSVMHPYIYKNRPSGAVVLSPSSQIGRSIKALFQVLYYGLHLAGAGQVYSRTAFDLSMLSCMLFSETDPKWNLITTNKLKTYIQRSIAALERYFPECISPKAHYVKHHILTDLDHHGNPSSYNCNGGERKMKVEKLAQKYSNKQRTNFDTTKKLLKVEVTRHIVTGGIYSDAGEKCGNAVEEFCRSDPCQDYLGIVKEDCGCKVKMGDWTGKRLTKSRPKNIHILAGCPDRTSTTWKRVTINGVKIVRGGGVKFRQRDRREITGIISQIYKNEDGIFVIVNKLIRMPCYDQLLSFTEAKIYDLTPSCVLVNNVSSLRPHILLHCCDLEDNPCPFVQIGDKMKLNCVGSEGSKFMYNQVALARYN